MDDLNVIHYSASDMLKNRTYLCYYWDIDESEKEISIHGHLDYYEFIITIDDIVHYINSDTEIIPAGNLIFVRLKDRHFINSREGHTKLLYLGIKKKYVEDMLDVIDDASFKSYLFSSKNSPYIQLEYSELEQILKLAKSIVAPQYEQSNKTDFSSNAYFKFVAFSFFSYFYKALKKDNSEMPEWLHKICTEMCVLSNLSKGFPRMLELCNYSRGYLCHCMKKYCHTNPTDYINELRLSYIARQLIVSDTSISEICFDSGFNNVGYMYKLFKIKYGLTPSQFRHRNSIPNTIYEEMI